jgi:hypothetical protein
MSVPALHATRRGTALSIAQALRYVESQSRLLARITRQRTPKSSTANAVSVGAPLTRHPVLARCRFAGRQRSTPHTITSYLIPFTGFTRYRGSSSAPRPQPSANEMSLNIPIALSGTAPCQASLATSRAAFRCTGCTASLLEATSRRSGRSARVRFLIRIESKVVLRIGFIAQPRHHYARIIRTAHTVAGVLSTKGGFLKPPSQSNLGFTCEHSFLR